MQYSFELRNPFLDFNLVEIALSIPDYLRFKNGYTKSILRNILTHYQSDQICFRKDKKGFEPPYLSWYLDNKKYFDSILLNDKFKDFIKTKEIAKLIKNTYFIRKNIKLIWKSILFCSWINEKI